MAIVNGSLQLGYKNSTWFAANPTLVLKEGQAVFLEQTGTYKLGDGTSQLSALTFLGGANSSVDGLQSGGTITVGTFGGSGTNNDIRVSAASWLINPTIYSTAINTDFLDIALSSAGLQRYIGLYGTTSNTITKVEGSEAALATYPTTPANTIVIGYVLVNDASASSTPDLSGYLLKLDKATQATNTTGTNDSTYVTPLSNAIKENTSNKSTSTADFASSVKFPVWSAIVSYFDVTKIKSILGITTLSGSNTGDQDLSGLMVKTNNLSDLSSSKTARVNIGLDKRTTFGNVDYSALITDREIVTSVAFTAPRTVTLIAGLNAGAEVIVADEFQTVTSTNTLTIQAPTGKYLNGVLNGTEVIRIAGGWRRFLCDGSDNYIFDAGIERTSNKSDSYTASSTITYTNTKALVDGLATKGMLMKHTFSANVNPADSTFYYFGNNSVPITSTANNVGDYIREIGAPITGTIKSAIVSIFIGNGGTVSNESTVITLRNTSTNTNYTVTSSFSHVRNGGTVKVSTYTGLNIPITLGNLCQTIFETPVFATNPTNCYYCVDYIIY